MIAVAVFFLLAAPAFAPERAAPPCANIIMPLVDQITRIENTRPALRNPGGIYWRGKLQRYRTLAEGHGALHYQVEKNVFARFVTLDEFFLGGPTYRGYAAESPGYSAVVARALRWPRNVVLAGMCE